MIKIAILGGSGYTALELIRIFLRHQQVEIAAVVSRQASRGRQSPVAAGDGTPLVSDLHPSLTNRINLRCEAFDADRLVARGVQCAFGCLPHGVSMETIPVLLD